ncbi:hypothetical protein MLD38_011973 [Melastoma candidum]|uniref:Uncharacterized protein n=1 Tax=Melastoma candidum TaxID=119954 RepID=A0ACB9R4V6_9MYRT|nr:hypothetical protein MLD38_011973 [Melastoma candidum]
MDKPMVIILVRYEEMGILKDVANLGVRHSGTRAYQNVRKSKAARNGGSLAVTPPPPPPNSHRLSLSQGLDCSPGFRLLLPSFVDRRPSLLLDVGSSNLIYSASLAKRMESAAVVSMKDVTIDEDTADSKIGMSTRQNVMNYFPSCGFGKGPLNEVDADDDAPDVGNSGNGDHENDPCYQAERKSKPEKIPLAFPCQNVGRIMDLLKDEPAGLDPNRDERASGCCSKKQVMKLSSDAAISPLCENNAIDAEILACPMEDNHVRNPGFPLSEKLESTDENGIGEGNSQNAGGAAIQFATLESSREVKSQFIHGTQNQLSNPVPIGNRSPEKNGFFQSHWEDNERPCFEASADKQLFKGKTSCHDSAESCNSAMVVKKRRRFDQQLFVRNNKAKNIPNQPLSSGAQDSSFLTWISNVMKGLSRPTVDAGVPLSLAFSSPRSGPELGIRTQISEHMRHTGFKTFFQSIYLPSRNNPELGLSLTVKEARSGSSPTGRLNDVCIGDDPAPCHEGTDTVGKQLLLLNKEINDDAPVIMAGPSSLPPGVGRVAISEQENVAYCGEDNVSVGKDALVASNSSLLEHKTMKVELAEEKVPLSDSQGDCGSLWIRRFSSKENCSTLKHDEATKGHENATYGSHNSLLTLKQSPQSSGLVKKLGNAAWNESNGQVLVRARGQELPSCHVGIESSVGYSRVDSCNEKDNVRKVDVMSPSECLKSSEEMASIFARRLDALKRHIPTSTTKSLPL